MFVYILIIIIVLLAAGGLGYNMVLKHKKELAAKDNLISTLRSESANHQKASYAKDHTISALKKEISNQQSLTATNNVYIASLKEISESNELVIASKNEEIAANYELINALLEELLKLRMDLIGQKNFNTEITDQIYQELSALKRALDAGKMSTTDYLIEANYMINELL